MAQGKFSKPRGRFQSPRNTAGVDSALTGDSFDLWDSFPEEEPGPAEPLNEEPLFPSEASGMPPLSRPKAPLLPEEEAMDHAFTEVTGANRDEPNPPDGFFLRNRKILLVSVCAFALVVILGIIGFVAISSAADPYNGKILNNVLIGDIPVGGLTRSQAEAAVR